MLVPLSWLKDFVDIAITPQELQEKLFSCGFEVDQLTETGRDITNVVVGQVIASEPIPDTKLTYCTVDAGDHGTLQVCCGASNVRVNGKYPLALPGATVYGTSKDHKTIEGVVTIGKHILRGYESYGMLCSSIEIGVPEDLYPGSGGLLELPDSAPVGTNIKSLVGLDDWIFDIEITANRPDCQSILGIAREIAAILRCPLKMPPLDYPVTTETIDFHVDVQNPALCPRYMTHYVYDIQTGPSPVWMRRRLAMVGVNSISNIVDITNYVLKEIGQPMHAFDAAKLKNNRITVRTAEENEKIVTLDGQESELTPANLVICDGEKPIALAGIMGGMNTEIERDTHAVIFEAAKFARDNIRRTSRSLGISSDSSLRFEKGVDEYSTALGIRRALHLVSQLKCGAISSTGIAVADDSENSCQHLTVSISKINGLLGIQIPLDNMLDILSSLSFDPVIDGDSLILVIPPYRKDIETYQDVAEELIRMYGYSHITSTFLNTASVTYGGRTAEQKNELKLKNVLCTQGFYETMAYSFYSPKGFDMIHLPPDAPERHAVRVVNPIGENLSVMRTILIPSMLTAITRNLRRGNMSGRLFEISKTFVPERLPLEDYPQEVQTLSLGWFGDEETFFTAKGTLEVIGENFGLNFSYRRCEKPYLHPGISAYIYCDDEVVGCLGKLDNRISKELVIEKSVFLGEINLSLLSTHFGGRILYRPISRFLEIKRDIALVVDENITCEEIEKQIYNACPYVENVSLFDIYRGEQVEKNKKSMAFTLTFRPCEHEFSDGEVDTFIRDILQSLAIALKIDLRS